MSGDGHQRFDDGRQRDLDDLEPDHLGKGFAARLLVDDQRQGQSLASLGAAVEDPLEYFGVGQRGHCLGVSASGPQGKDDSEPRYQGASTHFIFASTGPTAIDFGQGSK